MDRSLAYLKCGTVSKHDVEKAIEVCHQNNLPVYGSFIFGAPDETLEEMNECLNWIKQHRSQGLTLAYASNLIIYPGTDLYDYAVKNGVVDPAHFDYDNTSPSFTYPLGKYIVDKALSPKEFRKFFDYAIGSIWLDNQVALRNRKALLTRTFRKYLVKHFGEALTVVRLLIS